MVPGYDGHTRSSLGQAADLVVFDAAVHSCDSDATAGVIYSGLLTINRYDLLDRLCRQILETKRYFQSKGSFTPGAIHSSQRSYQLHNNVVENN